MSDTKRTLALLGNLDKLLCRQPETDVELAHVPTNPEDRDDKDKKAYLGHILIHGPPGFGKTTLALQLTKWRLETTCPDKIKVYSLEVPVHSLETQYRRVGGSDEGVEFDDAGGASDETSFFQHVGQDELNLLVIDSITTLQGLAQHKGYVRSFLNAMRTRNCCVVATAEAHSELQYLETLFDTVIKFHDLEHNSFFSRHIQVAKARHSQIAEGYHPYEIVEKHGICVYPNMHAYNTLFVGEVAPADGQSEVTRQLAAPLFGSKLDEKLLGEGEDRKIPESVLLYGPDSTYKRTLLKMFAAECEKSTLVVDLSEDLRAEDWRQGSRVVNHSQGCDVARLAREQHKLLKSIPRVSIGEKIIYLLSGFVPEVQQEHLIMLLHDIMKDNKTRPSRIALYDNGAYAQGLAHLHSTKTSTGLFMPTLARMCHTAKMPLLIVMRSTSDRRMYELARPVTKLHLRTRLLSVFGKRVVAMEVDGTGPIDKSSRKESTPLVLKPIVGVDEVDADGEFLDTFINLNTDAPHRSPLLIYLPVEVDRDREYLERMKRLVKAACGESLGRTGITVSPIKPEDWGVLPSYAYHLADRPRENTVIMAVDELSRARTGQYNGLQDEKIFRRDVLLALKAEGSAADESSCISIWQPGLAITWVCVMLDALFAGLRQTLGPEIGPSEVQANFAKVLEDEKTWMFDVASVEQAFKAFERSGYKPSGNRVKDLIGNEVYEWKEGRTVWIWFSQLTELFRKHDKWRTGSTVISLPGGGWTADWWLHVMEGSASMGLGDMVVDKVLLSAEEQFTRYSGGMTIDVQDETAREAAWRYTAVTNAQVATIHKNANRRHMLPGYGDFTRQLVGLGKTMHLLWCNAHEDVGARDEICKEFVARARALMRAAQQADSKDRGAR